jgi:hypothetical protein
MYNMSATVTAKTTPSVTTTRRTAKETKVEKKAEVEPVKAAPAKVEAKATVAPAKVEAKVTAAPAKVEAKVTAAPVKVEAKATPAKVDAKATAKVEAKVEAKVTAKPKQVVTVTQKEETETTKVHVDAKKRRPRARPYSEIFAQVYEEINSAYKALQTATRALKALEASHNREVHGTRSRANTHRTPTIVFDQPLVDYFLSRLDPSELTVTRKGQDGEASVDLSDLSTQKCVHRTDVTQLYNKAFVKHDLRDSADRRFILYQNDPELLALLTQGYSEAKQAELQADLDQIKAGTFRLNIFNIQRFTSQHLKKVDMPTKVAETEVEVEVEVEDETDETKEQ